MTSDSAPAGAHDPGTLFDRHAERLRRTVRLRLDRRLVGIVDSSGVLALAREEALRRGAELDGPDRPDPFLWLRRITGEILARLHRERLGADVRGDISLYRGRPARGHLGLAGRPPPGPRRRRGRQGRRPRRAEAPAPGGAQRHGPDRPRGPHAPALRATVQRRGRRRPGHPGHLFLAMSHQRLGHETDARRELATGREWHANVWATRGYGESAEGRLLGFGWTECLSSTLVLHEAEGVVVYDPVFPADPFAPTDAGRRP